MVAKKKQDKSMHYIGPEPVLMVRSGSKQQSNGQYIHSNSTKSSTALQLIDDLIEEEAEQLEQPKYGWGGFEEPRGRKQSRESLQSGRSGRMSKSRSIERMATPGSKSRQVSAATFHDSDIHYGNHADEYADNRSREYNNSRSAYLEPHEQPYYPSAGRSRRATREMEEDSQLQKKSQRIWGRSPYHPISIAQGMRDTLTASKLRISIFVCILALIGITIGLIMFMVLPRPVSIKFIDIEHDENPEPYRVVPREQGVHLRVQSWVLVEVRNPNFFPAKIKKSQVTANWIMSDGHKEMFGGSITDEERLLKKREKYQLRLPITIEYMGNPERDPIYSDYISRCYFDEKGPSDRNIYLNFEIVITTEAKEINREGIIFVDRQMACPMGKDTIKKTLDQLNGVNQQRKTRQNNPK